MPRKKKQTESKPSALSRDLITDILKQPLSMPKIPSENQKKEMAYWKPKVFFLDREWKLLNKMFEQAKSLERKKDISLQQDQIDLEMGRIIVWLKMQ